MILLRDVGGWKLFRRDKPGHFKPQQQSIMMEM
jgi:hypothetical protein